MNSYNGGTSPLNTYVLGGVAALSGVLFGFDASIAASVGDAVNTHFGLKSAPFLQGLWVAAVPLGALFGALSGGWVSSRFGRKQGLLMNAVLFMAGILLAALAPNFEVYVFSRFLMGLAIGNSAVVTPMYLAEIAPPESRGRIVFFYQLSIVIGILISFLVGVVVDAVVTDTNLSWRIMLAVGLVPAGLFFFGMLRMPNSPRWLVEQGRGGDALAVLSRLMHLEKAHATLAEIEAAVANRVQVDLRSLFGKMIFPVILLGFFLQFFQQTTGINADMYFGPEIFREGGFSRAASMWAQVAMGAVNLGATILSIFLVDRLGRRKLMLVGVSGIILTLGLQAGLFHQYAQMAGQTQAAASPGTVVVCPNTPMIYHEIDGTESGDGECEETHVLTYAIFASILLYIVFFAISAGPLCWLMISEVFPLRFRGIGMSIAVAANWLVDYFVSQLFPWMKNDLGMAVTCLIYGGFTLLGLILALRFLPETRGVPLEKIEANIYAGRPLRELGRMD